MKRFVLAEVVLFAAVALAMLLQGCYYVTEPTSIYDNADIPNVGSQPFNILFFVARTIDYKSDPRGEWQSPGKTYATRSGDCEDYATLVLYMVQRDTDSEAMLAISQDHAWVVIDGHHWETIGCYEMEVHPPVRMYLDWDHVRNLIDE